MAPAKQADVTCQEQKSSKKHPLHGVYDQQLQHLIRLARQPGWKAYAWERAKALHREESGLFRGIAEDLKAAMLTHPTAPSVGQQPGARKAAANRAASTDEPW